MNQNTDPPQPRTRRDQQLAAILVAGKLLELDLPAAWSWRIDPNGILVQLDVVFDAAAAVAALRAWAEFLGATPRVAGDPYDTVYSRQQRVEMAATYRHVTVRVFDGVPVEHIPFEWFDEDRDEDEAGS